MDEEEALMFVWIGINVLDELSNVQTAGKLIEKELKTKSSFFNFPLHISLKISFEVAADTFGAVLKDISDIFENTEPFNVKPQKIERFDNIAWIRYTENDKLNALHDKICDTLSEKYGVVRHEYDNDYKFHTTLFMDEDARKVKAGYEKIKNVELPSLVLANKFCVGASPNGKLDTFDIAKTIVK